MAVSVISGSGSTLLQVDPTNLAARVSVRPLEVVGATSGGFFRVALKSGVIASAVANSPLWSFRWSTGSTLNCIVYYVKWNWVVTTAFASAQLTDFGLYFARSFSASDTGGTASLPSGNFNKKRTSFQTTAAADLRICTTGILTAGTRTLDTFPMVQRYAWQTAAVGNGPADFANLFGMPDEYPITLANSGEGLVINNLAAITATVGVVLYVEHAWAEVPTANF
jgi:hypothetical protein